MRRIICRSSPSIFITTVSEVSEFLELWNFLNVIVVIDGKHVAMGCPKNTRSLHHNYEGFLSQVLTVVCDARYKFISIDVYTV